jgi:hypothetical protein
MLCKLDTIVWFPIFMPGYLFTFVCVKHEGTLLHAAAQGGLSGLVYSLLDEGADVNELSKVSSSLRL